MPGVDGYPRHAPQYPGAQLPGHGGGPSFWARPWRRPVLTCLCRWLRWAPSSTTWARPRAWGPLRTTPSWGPAILEELGYPHVAQVVREHVHLDGTIMDPRPLREAEVVNYADKRVLHEDGGHPGGPLCRPQGALRAHSRGPGPHPGHGSQVPGPGGEILCLLAPDSSGFAPGQWRKERQLRMIV